MNSGVTLKENKQCENLLFGKNLTPCMRRRARRTHFARHSPPARTAPSPSPPKGIVETDSALLPCPRHNGTRRPTSPLVVFVHSPCSDERLSGQLSRVVLVSISTRFNTFQRTSEKSNAFSFDLRKVDLRNSSTFSSTFQKIKHFQGLEFFFKIKHFSSLHEPCLCWFSRFFFFLRPKVGHPNGLISAQCAV